MEFINCINYLKTQLKASIKLYGGDIIESIPSIYIRHNICFSLEEAVNIAKLENEHSIVSNYFVSLRSKNYNLLSTRNKSNLKEILVMGHSINLLILDRKFISFNRNMQTEYLLKELEIFKNYFNIEISAFSCCNPFGDHLITEYYVGNLYSLSSEYQHSNFKIITDIAIPNFAELNTNYLESNLNYDVIMHPYFWNIIDLSSENWTEKYNAFLSIAYS